MKVFVVYGTTEGQTLKIGRPREADRDFEFADWEALAGFVNSVLEMASS